MFGSRTGDFDADDAPGDNWLDADFNEVFDCLVINLLLVSRVQYSPSGAISMRMPVRNSLSRCCRQLRPASPDTSTH